MPRSHKDRRPELRSHPATTLTSGPLFEYIQILRSYLTDADKMRVKRRIERAFRRGGHFSVMDYAALLQQYLTPDQRWSALERLEASVEEHHWISSPHCAHA